MFCLGRLQKQCPNVNFYLHKGSQRENEREEGYFLIMSLRRNNSVTLLG
jgi:hypothetical protein